MKYFLLILFVVLNIETLDAQEYCISYPKHNQVVSDTNVNIHWNENASSYQSDSYRIQIATDSLFQYIILDSSQLANSRLNVNLSYGAYFTRVKPLPLSPFPSLPFSSSSKFTIFSPKSLDSLILWLAADTGITKDASGKVSQWNDLSEYNHHAVQTNNIMKPSFLDSVLGSHSAVSFLGGNFILTGQYSILKPSNKNRSIFMFLDNHYISGYNVPYANYENNINSYLILEPQLFNYSLRLYLGNGLTTQANHFFGSNDKIRLKLLVISGLLVNEYNDGIFNGQYQFNQSRDSISRFAIGGRTSNGTNVSNPFNGQVFEIIDYAKPLDSAEIQLVNKYLLDKYTPPVNLGQNILRRYGFCDTTLSTNDMYEGYLWSTGDTTRSISIAKEDTGWYWCDVPNLYGDLMRDSVYVYDLVGETNLKDTTICLYSSSNIETGLTLRQAQGSAGQAQGSAYPYAFEWKNGTGITVSTDSILQTSQAGQYTLEVTDSFGCSLYDTVQVFVDSFELQASLGPDKSVCTGDKIGLVVGQAQADSFLWSTGSPDSLLVINMPGTYNLQTWNFRSCLAKDTITVDIHGVTPYVNFSAEPVCFNDSTLFLDSSYSQDQSNLILWEFNYGDGSPLDTSTGSVSGSKHLYSNSGYYTVKLTVSTDSNCSNFAYRNVYVRPLPQPDFYPLTGCQNHELPFLNLTKHTDSMAIYHWDFGTGDTAIQKPTANSQQPALSYIYSNSGQFSTQLTAYDKNGCTDSITKPVDILPSPIAAYSYSKVCDGTPVSFADQTQTLPYNPVMTYLWDFGTPPNSTSPSPIRQFSSSGIHPVKLHVTTLNGCWDTITQDVKVHAIPQVGFILQNACSGSPSRFIDTSLVADDSITLWHWNFYSHGSSTLASPTVVYNDTLIHQATLRVNSSAGCEDSLQQFFKIYPSPVADFSMDREYGLPPLTVNFSNLYPSTGSGDYWSFGDGQYSTLVNPTHIYVDSAIFYPQLVVKNEYNCKDSISHPVYVVYAAVDIAVTEVVSKIENGFARFSCEIENRGQQKVKEIQLNASHNGGLPIQEIWTGELLPGATTSYVFQAKIQVNGTPTYFCVTAEPLNDIQDEYSSDNTLCKEYSTQFWIGDVYPNPAQEYLNLDMILPVNQTLSIQLTNNNGNIVKSLSLKAQRGLNQYHLSTLELSSGTYYLRVDNGEEVEVRTFIVL